MLDTFRKINNPVPVEAQFAIAEIHELSADALALLNKEEKKELESFTNLKRQQEYLTSRLVLKELAKELDLDNEQFVILKDELGCPYGTDHNNSYYVSIAHSKKDVFCGIASFKSIGVDLEPLGRQVSPRLMQRIMHPGDADLLAEMEPIRLWTIKESLIKLEGQGLRLNMNEVHVRNNKNGFFVEINNDKTAKICSFKADENWLAIAFYI